MDFSIDDWDFEVDYCNNFMLAWADVSSPSESIPGEVKAEINGQNVSMTPTLFLMTGDLNNKDISEGIRYYSYVDNPSVGEYNLTIHAGNSSGYVGSSMLQIEYNKTMAIENLASNGTGDYMMLGQFQILFTLDVNDYLEEILCINKTILTINGTDYTMIEDDTDLFDKYKYIMDFGSMDYDRLYNVNFTIVDDEENEYFVQGGPITLNKPVDESSLSFAGNSGEENEKYDLEFSVMYTDGLNNTPEFKISLNGTNQTVSFELFDDLLYEAFLGLRLTSLDAIGVDYSGGALLYLDPVSR